MYVVELFVCLVELNAWEGIDRSLNTDIAIKNSRRLSYVHYSILRFSSTYSFYCTMDLFLFLN